MKLKSTVLLATFVVTMGLLLGASTAQAATVILDEDDNVIRIEGLVVLDSSLEITAYNVDFVHDTAVNVYATGKFDFPRNADALAANLAVRDALNAEDPVPPGAGPQGSDEFFIGTTVRSGRVIAVGSQKIVKWDSCETDCLAGTAVLEPDDPFTYAKFTETEDVPPGPAKVISPSGSTTDDNPTYTWKAVTNATWYNLRVRDSANKIIIDEQYPADAADCGDGTGECSVTSLTVLADDLYRWWIQTSNEFGDGPWSRPAKFFTVFTTAVPPGPPTLISPNGTITENTPTYTWNAVANALEYRLFVWDSKEDVIIDRWYTRDMADCGDGTGECSVTPITALADDSHEWWIRTKNIFGQSPWSDELSFTVDSTRAPPGKAKLISPNGIITDNTPTYTWNAVANSAEYQLYVWDSTQEEIINQFYTADEADCGDGTGECSLTPETVLADDSHEWWIRTKNEFGKGDWSAKKSFIVVDTNAELNVILDEDDNVIRIENLLVFDENTQDVTIYDVDFVHDTAFVVYGLDLDFDFPAPENDENIFLALAEVNKALNAHDPTPVGAGPKGTNHFFIGYKQEVGLIVAAGGEPLAGVWGPCGTDPCYELGELQLGVAVLSPTNSSTWADFTVAE